MTHRMPSVLLLLAALGAVPGCAQQRLNEEKSNELEPRSTWPAFIVSAPKAQQQVRVTITATEAVDVDIAAGANQAAVQAALDKGKRPEASAVVASKQQMKNDSLDATIPAGQDYTVFITAGGKKASVKAKLHTP